MGDGSLSPTFKIGSKIRVEANSSAHGYKTSRSSGNSSSDMSCELSDRKKKPKIINYNIAHRLDFNNGKIDETSPVYKKHFALSKRLSKKISKKTDSSPIKFTSSKDSDKDSPFQKESFALEMKDGISPLPHTRGGV